MIFVPQSAPPAKVAQLLVFGGTVLLVRGTYDDAFELSLLATERFGWYNRNTAYNPFTTEGKKTAALEIAAQMAPEAPDVVVVPTGDGVIVSGVARGFADLERAGLIARRPRLVAVQPEGSAAIARALRSGASTITPDAGAASVGFEAVPNVLSLGANVNVLPETRPATGDEAFPSGARIRIRAVLSHPAPLGRIHGSYGSPCPVT